MGDAAASNAVKTPLQVAEIHVIKPAVFQNPET